MQNKNSVTMKQTTISEINSTDSFIKKRLISVSRDLIRCDIQIASRNNLVNSAIINDDYYIGACNKYEKEAAYFYKINGYDIVIKLDHWLVGGESHDEKSRVLGAALRRHMPKIEYEKFIFKPDQVRNSFTLNEVYPEHYSLSFYPPDFIVFNSKNGEWKFVEVKSPTDKLDFRQANWYINLMPDHWKYELFCLFNKDIEDIYITNDLQKKGAAFDSIYLEHTKKVDNWNEILETNMKLYPKLRLERERHLKKRMLF